MIDSNAGKETPTDAKVRTSPARVGPPDSLSSSGSPARACWANSVFVSNCGRESDRVHHEHCQAAMQGDMRASMLELHGARTVAGLYPRSDIIAQLKACLDSAAAAGPCSGDCSGGGKSAQRLNASFISQRSSVVKPRPTVYG